VETLALNATIRIIIADDHPLVRGALHQAVAGAVDGCAIVECPDIDSLTKELDENDEVDLVLLDLAMPGVRGFSGLMYLRAQHPGVPVVVVSGNEDRGVMRRCIDFGASGFIPKTTDLEAMRTAIRKVLAGGAWTPPDVDLSRPADQDTADIVRRMASMSVVLGMKPEAPKSMQRRMTPLSSLPETTTTGTPGCWARRYMRPEKPRTPGMARSSRTRSTSSLSPSSFVRASRSAHSTMAQPGTAPATA
jgi:hypothetical protein